MFVVGFLGMAVPLFVAIQLAYRLRPVYVRLSSQLDRYQEVIEPLRRLAMWGMPIFFGLFAGFAASGAVEDRVALGQRCRHVECRPAVRHRHRLLHVRDAVLLDPSRVRLGRPAAVRFWSRRSCRTFTGSVRIGQGELRISQARSHPARRHRGLLPARAGGESLARPVQDLVQPDDRITGAAYTGVNATIPASRSSRSSRASSRSSSSTRPSSAAGASRSRPRHC